MLLYRTATAGWWVETTPGMGVPVPQQGAGDRQNNESLTARDDLFEYLQGIAQGASPQPMPQQLLAPIEQQEVWASGVTYYRSREARMAESEAAGGGDFYDKVYHAERPELFFKAVPHRVVGPGAAVRIRRDSNWNVPEPELTLLLSRSGKITGYTIGNDMSSRDIEGANPLYLPQAKVYDASCSLGPAILVSRELPSPATGIHIQIHRGAQKMFSGSITLKEMKRPLTELAEYLYRESTFPHGALLLTGTGIVPPESFSLEAGDRVDISMDGIGTLTNTVERLA